MKKTLLILLIAAAAQPVFAQTYQEKAGEIQKMVWGDASPEFALKDVPPQYANESAVILAQSYKMQRTATSKFRYFIIAASVSQKMLRIATFHERIKLNDKSALEAYSTLEYQKRLDKSVNFLLAKFVNVHDTYIGAKIIKPNGKEVVVNTGEEVLLKDTGKDKQGKLAIPDLQVGDILDYYISTNDVTETENKETYKNNEQVFMQVNEYPILNYSLEFQISKKLDVQAVAANGAKQLMEYTPTKDDRIFGLKLKDLPKYESQIWTSPYRQYPYLEISNIYSTDYGNLSRKRDKSTSRLVALKEDFQKLFNEQYFRGFDAPEKKLKDHFDGNKGLKAASVDSTMKVLYDIWKYNVFGSYTGSDADDIASLNYRTANSKINAVNMSLLLTDLKVSHDVLLVSSRNTSSLDNAFNGDDINVIIRVTNGNRPLYMAFFDVFTQFNEIPVQYQGEKAIVLKPIRKNAIKYEFTESVGVLPSATSDDNQIAETVSVTIPAASMQKLQVVRTVKQTGYMRHDDQKTMLNPMDVDKQLMGRAQGDDLAKRLKASADTKKLSDAFVSGMVKSDMELKKIFTADIKSQFEQEPKEVGSYKVINLGMDGANPVFEYTSAFTLDNMVKKAGNNYIIDAAKLCGTFLKLEQKDRKRVIDVYMPGARSFKYNVNIIIPKGYKVKGVEEFRRSKNNKTGAFTASAVVNGSVLNISVSRAYFSNFEKAADWPLVAEIVDFASAFNDQKILLEKEG